MAGPTDAPGLPPAPVRPTVGSPSGAGAYRLFLPAGAHGLALTGSHGDGATALGIASLFDVVVCVCPDADAARRVVARRRNLRTVHAIVAAPNRLPFRNASCDHVGWHRVTTIATHASAVPVHPEAELRRVLKEGGSVFVSADRPETPTLRGAHRTIMRRLRRRFAPLGHVYHYPGLDDVRIVQHVPAHHRRPADWWLQGKRAIAGTNVGAVFVNAPSTRGITSLLGGIERDIAARLPHRLSAPRFAFLGSGGSLVCDLGGVVVRLPQHRLAAKRCAANFAALERLATRPGWSLAPRPLMTGVCERQAFFVESRLDGRTMDDETCNPAAVRVIHEQALRLLTDESLMLVARGTRESVQALIDRELEGLVPFVPADGHSVLRGAAAAACRVLADRAVPLVVQHGDFKFSNFRYERAPHIRLTGVIDWDLASIPGLPLVDLLTLCFDAQGRDPDDSVRAYYALARGDGAPAEVDWYRERWGLAEDAVRHLALFATLRYLNRSFAAADKATKRWQELIQTTVMAGEA